LAGTEKGYPRGLAFSRDGKLIAQSGDEGNVLLCSADSGQVNATLEVAKAVYAVAFSPDGKTLATASGNREGGEVQLWDLATNKVVREFKVERPAGEMEPGAWSIAQGLRLRWRWWLLSGLCCGLGVLTKGPVALVLLRPALVAYVWLQRDQARLGLFAWLVYGGVIALVAAPWFIAICVRQPEFAGQFIIEHHIKRFTAAGYHESPAWFYVPVLLVGTLPWSLLLVPFCQFLLSHSRLRPAGMGFLLLWAAWCFVFFSLSRGKLPPYVLPLLPAVALMMGCYLDRALDSGLAQPFFWSRTAVPQLGIGMLAGIWLTASVVLYLMRLTSEPVMVASVVVSAVCLVGTAVYGWRLSPHAAWALFGAVGLVVTWTAAHLFTPAWANRNAPLGQSAEATRLLLDGSIPVACFNREWGSIPFYVGHDNVRNFGGPTTEDLPRFLLAQRRALIVVRHDEVDQALCRVPAGMTVRVLEAGVARVALVEAMPAPLK
jgi:hypothetical protein